MWCPINRFDTARIGDFGLAKSREVGQGAVTGVTKCTQYIVGTQVYMSPEVLKGNRPCDLADVYALGVVMLEVLTGLEASRSGGRSDIVTHLEDACEDAPGGMKQYLDVAWADDDTSWKVIAELTVNCLKHRKTQRPNAAVVVERLEQGCAEAAQNEDETRCVICFDAPRVMAFVPCGHRCLCHECSAMFVHIGAICPLCRTPSRELVRMFE